MHQTLSFYALVFEKDFTAFCNQKLQEIGLTQGLLYFIIYIGKHPGCTAGTLIKDLRMDWGHVQRSIDKLAADGFIDKKRNEEDRRAYSLSLTAKGDQAFLISHQVFSDWDAKVLGKLSDIEKDRLFELLEKLVDRKGEYIRVRDDKKSD